MTSNETWIIVVATITLSFYFIVLLAAFHNVIKYLYLGDRVILSNVQLTSFYLNAIVVLMLRITQFSLELCKDLKAKELTIFRLYVTGLMFYLNLGGTIFLLMRNLDKSLYKIFVNSRPSFSFKRFFWILITFFFFDIVFAVAISMGTTEIGIKLADWYTLAAYTVLLIFLTWSTIRVFKQIENLKHRFGDAKGLEKEKWNILTMLIMFDLSFAVRIIFCMIFRLSSTYNTPDKLEFVIVTMIPSLFIEAVPILYVLIVHYQSFRETQPSS